MTLKIAQVLLLAVIGSASMGTTCDQAATPGPPTPTLAVSLEEVRYIEWRSAQAVDVNDLEVLLYDTAPPSHGWRTMVRRKAEDIIESRDQAQDIIAPPDYRALHLKYLVALEDYAEGARVVMEWIESPETDPEYWINKDIEELYTSLIHLENGSSFIEKATTYHYERAKKQVLEP